MMSKSNGAEFGKRACVLSFLCEAVYHDHSLLGKLKDCENNWNIELVRSWDEIVKDIMNLKLPDVVFPENVPVCAVYSYEFIMDEKRHKEHALVFRGTSTLSDFVADFSLALMNERDPGVVNGLVHDIKNIATSYFLGKRLEGEKLKKSMKKLKENAILADKKGCVLLLKIYESVNKFLGNSNSKINALSGHSLGGYRGSRLLRSILNQEKSDFIPYGIFFGTPYPIRLFDENQICRGVYVNHALDPISLFCPPPEVLCPNGSNLLSLGVGFINMIDDGTDNLLEIIVEKSKQMEEWWSLNNVFGVEGVEVEEGPGLLNKVFWFPYDVMMYFVGDEEKKQEVKLLRKVFSEMFKRHKIVNYHFEMVESFNNTKAVIAKKTI